VERTAGTMMQRMSDMLTRWLEGAMRRAENEAETDENPDRSDSSEQDSPAVSAQAETSAAVEASMQDVANIRLPPSPVNDDATASEVVNDVLCSASREVEKDSVTLSDAAATVEPVDGTSVSANRTSSKSDNSAVSGDSDSIVDSQLDCHSSGNQESAADNKPRNTLQSQPESCVTSSGCTSASVVVDGADSGELFDQSCSSVGADDSIQMENQHDRVAAEEKDDAVNVDKSPASPG